MLLITRSLSMRAKKCVFKMAAIVGILDTSYKILSQLAFLRQT